MPEYEAEEKQLYDKLGAVLREKIPLLKESLRIKNINLKSASEETAFLREIREIRFKRQRHRKYLNSLVPGESVTPESLKKDLEKDFNLQTEERDIDKRYLSWMKKTTRQIKTTHTEEKENREELVRVIKLETAIYKRLYGLQVERITNLREKYAKMSGAGSLIHVKIQDSDEALTQMKGHLERLKKELKHLRRKAKIVITGLDSTPEQKRLARLSLKRRGNTLEVKHDCEPGYFWSAVKGTCVSPDEISCPPGEYYSTIKGECLPIDPEMIEPSKDPHKRWVPKATTEKSCPQGWNWSPVHGICFPNGWAPDKWLKYLNLQTKI